MQVATKVSTRKWAQYSPDWLEPFLRLSSVGFSFNEDNKLAADIACKISHTISQSSLNILILLKF